MCGDNIAVHIIRRVLYRRKFLNIPANGKDDDAARMLSCRPAHPGASLDDPVDLTVPLSLSSFLIIVLHIAKGSLFCQGADGPRFKGLSGAENNLYIPVGFSLVISGKVQVDIRLFVPLKSQEGFKRNIKSFLFQRFPAHRTLLIRHIAASPSRIGTDLLRFKICIMALRAIVVRAQRIHLGNT